MGIRQPIEQYILANVVNSTAATGISTQAVLQDRDFNGLTFKVIPSSIGGTNPTLDIWLQSSDDGGTTWFDVMRFPRITASTPASAPYWGVSTIVDATRVLAGTVGACTISSTAGGVGVPLLSGNLRVQWALGGTTPTASFSVTTEELDMNRGQN